ncbi:MAG: magnesium transporter MgtE N-terminal domain-containing protein, partial [Holosporales bacterium]
YLVCGTSSVMAIGVSVEAHVQPLIEEQATIIVQKAPVEPQQATIIAAKEPVEDQRAISSEKKLQKLVTLLSGTKKAVEKFSALDSKKQLELFKDLFLEQQVELFKGLDSEKQVELLNSFTPEKQVELLNSFTPEKQVELLNGFTPEKQVELFNSLPFKEAVTMFNLLSPAEKRIAYPKLNKETRTEILYNFAQSSGKKGKKLLQKTVKIKEKKTGKTINDSDYKWENGKTETAFKKYLQKQAAAEERRRQKLKEKPPFRLFQNRSKSHANKTSELICP